MDSRNGMYCTVRSLHLVAVRSNSAGPSAIELKMACGLNCRHPAGAPHLPDMIHELVPQVTHIWLPGLGRLDSVDAIDLSMGALVVATALLVITRRAPWLVLRRTLVIHGSILLLRCLTVMCTSLPDSRPMCHAVTPGTVPLRDLTSRSLLAIAVMNRRENITCGDMVFSGHTAVCVLMAMVWHSYYNARSGTFAVNYIKVGIWLWVTATICLIVTARLHYTLDAFLGVYLAVTMWGGYHRVADDILLKHRFYSGT